jgi:hypothetical protein
MIDVPNGQAAPRYCGFISYNRDDSRLARRLHKALESYRIPKELLSHGFVANAQNKEGLKLGRFFLDEEELAASTGLGPALYGALQDSNNLIVIASPAAARSAWVNEEVDYYKSKVRRRVFAVIASGVPNNRDNECLPAALRSSGPIDDATSSGNNEPGAPDITKEPFSRDLIRLVAGILGVPFDSLWKRELRRKKRRFISTTVGLAALTTTVLVPTLILWDLHDRRQSVANLISETCNEINNGQYENATKIALEGLPVKHDVPWALGWNNESVKSLAAELAGAAQLVSVIGGAKDSGNVTSVAFSPDGNLILTSSEAGTATIWDANSIRPLVQCNPSEIFDAGLLKRGSYPNGAFKPGIKWVRDSQFSKDGGKVVSTGYFGLGWIWTFNQGRCEVTAKLLGHISDVRTGAFNPDGSRVVTTSDDGTVRLWSSPDGKPLGLVSLLPSNKLGVYTTSAGFKLDDKTILLTRSDGLVAIADSETKKISEILQTKGPHVSSARFSRDGRLVVYVSDDGSIDVMDPTMMSRIPLPATSARREPSLI